MNRLQRTLLLLFFHTLVFCQQPICLHNGCEMSAGKSLPELENSVSNVLRPGEFKDNVISAVSWNIQQEDATNRPSNAWLTTKKDVCRFLSNIKPTFLGFQNVNLIQMKYIKLCMRDYTIIQDKFNQPDGEQNLLALKNTRRLKLRNYGSFTTNPVNPRSGNFQVSSCTWARVQFAHRITEIPESNTFLSFDQPSKKAAEKLYDLLSLLLPQQNRVDVRNRVRRSVHPRYRWSNFYVAVAKINFDDEETAKKQTQALLMHLRNKILDRRRYPLILMIDLGKEDNSVAYEVLLKNRHWLRNTMVHSTGTFPAMTKLSKNDPSSEMLSDYVFKHRFHGLVAAVLSDDIVTKTGASTHRPVYSSLLRFR